MRAAIAQAEEIVKAPPDAFIPQQFRNPANPDVHRHTTAEEIWNDTGGTVDLVVSGVDTDGTLTGVGPVLKPRKPGLRMVAVEPEDSAVLPGRSPGPNRSQDIGAGFIPEILDTKLIDEIVVSATRPRCAPCARRRAVLETGARAEMKGKTIVVMLPDFGER
jgi:cysteine synthase